MSTMSTMVSRNRINITLTNELKKLLEQLAKIDGVPMATKATELLIRAVEEQEDHLDLLDIKERRDDPGPWLNHEEVWS